MIAGLYLKAGIAAALFIAGIGVGCTAQAKRDKDKLEAADHTINFERQQNAVLAATLVGIDEETARQVDAAKAQAKQGEQAVKESVKAETVYRDRLVYVDREIQEGKRQPVCRAQLEAELCVSLH